MIPSEVNRQRGKFIRNFQRKLCLYLRQVLYLIVIPEKEKGNCVSLLLNEIGLRFTQLLY